MGLSLQKTLKVYTGPTHREFVAEFQGIGLIGSISSPNK